MESDQELRQEVNKLRKENIELNNEKVKLSNAFSKMKDSIKKDMEVTEELRSQMKTKLEQVEKQFMDRIHVENIMEDQLRKKIVELEYKLKKKQDEVLDLERENTRLEEEIKTKNQCSSNDVLNQIPRDFGYLYWMCWELLQDTTLWISNKIKYFSLIFFEKLE